MQKRPNFFNVLIKIKEILALLSVFFFIWTFFKTRLNFRLHVHILFVGGAFNTPPPWLSWGKYASFFFYGLQALIVLEFKDAPPIK